MLILTLREGEKLHVGEAVLTVERKGNQFAVRIQAPLSVNVFRERVLENLRNVLNGQPQEVK